MGRGREWLRSGESVQESFTSSALLCVLISMAAASLALITGALSQFTCVCAFERTRKEVSNLQLTKTNTEEAKPKENKKIEVG